MLKLFRHESKIAMDRQVWKVIAAIIFKGLAGLAGKLCSYLQGIGRPGGQALVYFYSQGDRQVWKASFPVNCKGLAGLKRLGKSGGQTLSLFARVWQVWRVNCATIICKGI